MIVNNLTVKGIDNIANILSFNTSLVQLALSSNNIVSMNEFWSDIPMDKEQVYKLIEAASKSKLKYLGLNNDIVPEELRFWGDGYLSKYLDVEKIRKYFEDLVRKGKSKNKRCKLMIVGKENQGKTSLLHYLKEGKSIGKTTKSTDGIDVNLWNIKNNKDDNDENEVIFSTWDFAGQEVIIILLNW